MENLTPTEFNKLYTNHTAQIKRDLKKFKKLEAEGINEHAKFKSTTGVNFLKRESVRSDDLNYGGGVDSAIELLVGFKEECKAYENKINFNTDTDFYADSDGWIERVCYEARWSVVIDEVAEQNINSSFKNKIANLLKPEKASYTQGIDCKLLTLFKDGKISWDTLRTLVYSDCEI